MAQFECKVVKIEKKAAHPNADRLTIYQVSGYNCISNKLPSGEDRYNVGDVVVYIPEGSLIPQWLLKKMDLWDETKDKGVLGGHDGNRVTTVKLRGVPSSGLIYPCSQILGEYVVKNDEETIVVSLDDDVSQFLGIKKYVQPVPTSLGGQVFSSDWEIVFYDVEPIQKYKHLMVEGEEVVMETKVHGTNCRWYFSQTETHPETFGQNHNIFIASKGLGDKGLYFKNTVENERNVYCKAFIDGNVEQKVYESHYWKQGYDIQVCCEVYGSGIQDLTYGMTGGQFTFACFDVFVKKQDEKHGRFLNYDEFKEFCEEVQLPMVDVLYRGPYSMEMVEKYTDGFDTIGTDPTQIREGIVIKPLNERWDEEIGRVMVKSVSQIYKLRKGHPTEFN